MHHEALTKDGARLFPLLTNFNDFYLAGGTALALEIGHRVSVDFDFFSPNPIPRALFAKVNKIFRDSTIEPIINNRDELTILVDTVKRTFLTYPFPVIEPLVLLGGLSLLSVAEIGATKAYSIGRRGTYKDYVDLYVILANRYASLDAVISMAEKKFTTQFNSRLFAEQLLFMDDIEDYKIEFVGTPVSQQEILAFFADELQKFSFA